MNLRWGLLAAGSIAAEFADGIKASETGTVARGRPCQVVSCHERRVEGVE